MDLIITREVIQRIYIYSTFQKRLNGLVWLSVMILDRIVYMN
jgi:hypothetical protein